LALLFCCFGGVVVLLLVLFAVLPTHFICFGMAAFKDIEGISSNAMGSSERMEELWNILFQVKKVPLSVTVAADVAGSDDKGVCTKLLLTYCEKHQHGDPDAASVLEGGEGGLLLDRFGPSGFKPLHYLCSVVRLCQCHSLDEVSVCVIYVMCAVLFFMESFFCTGCFFFSSAGRRGVFSAGGPAAALQ
jgi:hypothetical protein